MRKCGPFSEGFSTRVSLALTLSVRVRIEPVKPLPFEVKVPMVAIVVSFQVSGRVHRDLDGWRQTGGDRPAPRRGRHAVKGSQGATFLSCARNGRAAVQGKKVVTGCCGGKSEAARSDDALRSDMPNRGPTWVCKKKRPR